VIDLTTEQVTTVPVPITPHDLQVSRDGRSLLVVGVLAAAFGGHSETGTGHGNIPSAARGRLLIFDTATMSPEGATAVEVGRSPQHVIMDAPSAFAYVTNGEDNTLSVVDIQQRTVILEIRTGKSPHGLRMSPDAREIYVANTGDDSVSVIDVAGAQEVAVIPVGKAPVQVGFTPDGGRVYVSSTVENSVSVIDTAQRKRSADVPVGRNPIQVVATPNGRYVYVANEGTRDSPDNRTSVIATLANQVVATIETCKGAHGVVVGDDGKQVFVACTFDSTVSVIDTGTRRVTRNIKVGGGSAGITFRSARQ
jgi:YVTN family beta-propeller protein